jgi:hypothetical protein
MKNWIIRNVLSPYILSLLLAIIIILLLPPLFERFEIIPAGQEINYHKNPDSYLIFRDINNDGRGEKIDCFYEGGKRASVQVYSHDGAILDQWNFRGGYTREREDAVAIGDYNGDGMSEIIVFTIVNDSIFFSCIDKLDGSFRFKEKHFVNISTKYSSLISYRLLPEGFYDLTGDGFLELVITVGGARSLQPRQVYAYDFVNDSLFASASYGTGLSAIRVFDSDKDGRLELTGNTGAWGNVHDSLGIPYSDYSAWFMVLNHRLEPEFKPVEFPGFRNDLMVVPFRKDDSVCIAALLNPVGTALEEPVLIMFSQDGKKTRDRKMKGLPRCSRQFIPNPFDLSDASFLITEPERMMVIDDQFHIIGDRKFRILHNYYPEVFDLQNDQKPELVFTDETCRQLIIYHSLKHRPTVYMMPEGMEQSDISLGLSGKGSPVILLQKPGKYQVLTYESNPLFYLRWLVFTGIYAALLLFVLAIRKLQQIQMERRQAIRDQILQLQLKSVHNQMDPHFTFNVFNSIASIIRNDEKEFAFQSFLKFTGIVRSMLTDSDKIERKLEDEIRFVENYLALEKLRYKDRIDYEIRISPDVNREVPVPKMILQIFAENAVKHGLRHRPKGGRLMIEIKNNEKRIEMTVEDNGVGREKAKELSKDSTGMGLKIIDRYVELFNELKGRKIHYGITDLFQEDGTASGTKVTIMI